MLQKIAELNCSISNEFVVQPKYCLSVMHKAQVPHNNRLHFHFTYNFPTCVYFCLNLYKYAWHTLRCNTIQ